MERERKRFIEELAHTVIEAKKSPALLSASWIYRKACAVIVL